MHGTKYMEYIHSKPRHMRRYLVTQPDERQTLLIHDLDLDLAG